MTTTMTTSNGERRRILTRIESRLARLYGDERAASCTARLKLLMSCYDRLAAARRDGERWSERESLLITYGDSIRKSNEKPLCTLKAFLDRHCADSISCVHILPFFPWSSDDGFSVIDYRKVDPQLGDWDDVRALGQKFSLMFDLVLNHCSKHSDWFSDYIAGVAPHTDYFIDVEPGTDLSQVVRPRQSPLLTQVQTRHGERWVWTTFSEDQVDLNFANPDVLLEFIDILLGYFAAGARIIRLDAIAYLWKRIGTNCIHLPETHEVVKLMRDIVDLVDPLLLLLTETNVPHAENVSYFGDGDEAHIVYNFSLPPLVLLALQTGSGAHLTRWAKELSDPPDNCTYLNFTASHDGIGVRPLEGLVDAEERDWLVERVQQLGGQVSSRSNPDGTASPYELNITYFDAMGRPGEDDLTLKIRRFLCSQAIALALRGIPAIYIQSLVAASNDMEGLRRLGYARAINRHKWDEDDLRGRLKNRKSQHARVLNAYKHMLAVRREQAAFHPDAPQRVHDLGEAVFVIERRERESDRSLFCLHNLTGDLAEVTLPGAPGQLRNLLDADAAPVQDGACRLGPYEVAWLAAE